MTLGQGLMLILILNHFLLEVVVRKLLIFHQTKLDCYDMHIANLLTFHQDYLGYLQS